MNACIFSSQVSTVSDAGRCFHESGNSATKTQTSRWTKPRAKTPRFSRAMWVRHQLELGLVLDFTLFWGLSAPTTRKRLRKAHISKAKGNVNNAQKELPQSFASVCVWHRLEFHQILSTIPVDKQLSANCIHVVNLVIFTCANYKYFEKKSTKMSI